MLLDDKDKECDLIYSKVYERLKFKPSCDYRGHSMMSNLPFEIEGSFAVYGIDKMSDAQIDLMDEIIREAFISATQEDERMYALDWHHSTFLFNPRNIEEQKSFWKEDDRYWGGGYNAYFPSFYPDGDYYFFIDEDFRFGYLGHPWRQEIWVFGDELIEKIEQIYQDLGWEKIH